MKNALVIGSSGFIGSHLINYLSDKGYSTFSIDKVRPKFVNTDYPFEQCDILEGDKLKKIILDIRPNTIIHLAARTDLDETKDIQGYASNIEGVENLITAIRQTPSVKRCIFTSSQLVCKIGYVPKDEYDYNPHTLYGESKVLTEKIVRENDGGGVEWCIVRPTTVWGPGMSSHYQRFLKMIDQGLYFHVGNSPLYKSYSYIGNIIYQYLKIMEAPSNLINKRTFYLADYEPISLRQWTNLIQQEMNVKTIPTYPESLVTLLAILGDFVEKIGIKNVPFNSFRLNNILTEYVFDLSETEKVCGALPYSIEDGVKELVLWLNEEKILV